MPALKQFIAPILLLLVPACRTPESASSSCESTIAGVSSTQPAASQSGVAPGLGSKKSIHARDLCGRWYCGDGLGYNVKLDLSENGTYTATWHGCLGEYGKADGQWGLQFDRLRLTPKHETDLMRGHLRELHIVPYNRDIALVRNPDDELYREYGVTRYSAFQRSE